METADIIEEPSPRPLSNEQIAKDRAAAAQYQLPDSPMESTKGDIITHPSADFKTMSDKLDAAMKEVQTKKVQPDKSSAPDPSIKEEKRVDPKDKKSAEPAATEDVADKTITSAKAADWKAIKEKLKAQEALANEFKQKHELTTREYEEFKKKATDIEKVETALKERDTIKAEKAKLEEQLKAVALERSEQFNSYFQKKFEAAVTQAKAAAGPNAAERVEQLLALPPSKWRKEQLNAMRDEIEGIDQAHFDNAVIKNDEARAEREAQLKDASAGYQKLQELENDRKSREKETDTKRREAAMAGVLEFARSNFSSFKASDDQESATVAAESEAFVKKFFNRELEQNQVALLPVLAREAGYLQERVVPRLQARIAELEATVKGMNGASPKAGGGGDPQPKSGSTGKSFSEVFMENLPGQRR